MWQNCNSSVSFAVIPSFRGVSAFSLKVFWKIYSFFCYISRQWLRKSRIIFAINIENISLFSQSFRIGLPGDSETWEHIEMSAPKFLKHFNFMKRYYTSISYRTQYTIHLGKNFCFLKLERRRNFFSARVVNSWNDTTNSIRETAKGWIFQKKYKQLRAPIWAGLLSASLRKENGAEHIPDQDVSREALPGP
jgi:hypothetical protein